MNDERFLADWLADTTTSDHDPSKSARQVMAKVPKTRQRGRWWPLPSVRRSTPSVVRADLPQRTPVSAPLGDTPTVIGRTQSMFSPAKAIAAAALVFAVGGVLLIAQPFDQQGGGVPGAATDGAAQVAVVSGQFESMRTTKGPQFLPKLDGMEGTMRDEEQVGRAEMSDARLTGDVTLTFNFDRWQSDQFEAEGDAAIFWGTVSIENEVGTWVGTHMAADQGAADQGEVSSWVSKYMELVGTGAYEGWSAILYESETFDPISDESTSSVNGMVFPGDLPPR
jgi:hypothetical protein